MLSYFFSLLSEHVEGQEKCNICPCTKEISLICVWKSNVHLIGLTTVFPLLLWQWMCKLVMDKINSTLLVRMSLNLLPSFGFCIGSTSTLDNYYLNRNITAQQISTQSNFGMSTFCLTRKRKGSPSFGLLPVLFLSKINY